MIVSKQFAHKITPVENECTIFLQYYIKTDFSACDDGEKAFYNSWNDHLYKSHNQYNWYTKSTCIIYEFTLDYEENS